MILDAVIDGHRMERFDFSIHDEPEIARTGHVLAWLDRSATYRESRANEIDWRDVIAWKARDFSSQAAMCTSCGGFVPEDDLIEVGLGEWCRACWDQAAEEEAASDDPAD